MSKNRRMMLLLLSIIVYTFLMGVLEENVLAVMVISTFTLLLVAYLSLNVVMRFDIRYVKTGDIHRENIYTLTLFSLPLVFTVYLYALNSLGTGAIIGISILSGFIGLYLLVFYFFNHIIIKEDGLVGTYIFYKNKKMLFADIKSVTYHTVINCMVLTDESNDKLFVDIMLKDAQMILNTLSEKLEEEIYKEGYNKLAKFFKSIKVEANLEQVNYFQK